MNLQDQRRRLSADIVRFSEMLGKARTEFEKSRIRAVISGTEMMLAALDKQAAAQEPTSLIAFESSSSVALR